MLLHGADHAQPASFEAKRYPMQTSRSAPTSMMKLNFSGPTASFRTATEARYVLLTIDYFFRFVFVRPYVFCTMALVADLLVHHIISVVGYPRAIYSNNESHFTRDDIEQILEKHDVIYFSVSVTHSSSVRSIERAVQIIISGLRTHYIVNEKLKSMVVDSV